MFTGRAPRPGHQSACGDDPEDWGVFTAPSRYPSCSVRFIEKGYTRQRHTPFARACAHADRLRLASLASQAFSSEAASVVKQKPNRAAHGAVSGVGIAAHSRLLSTIPMPT